MKRVATLQAKEAAALNSGITEKCGGSTVDEAASGVADSISGLDLNSEGIKKDNDDKMPETVFQSTTAAAAATAASGGDQVSNT